MSVYSVPLSNLSSMKSLRANAPFYDPEMFANQLLVTMAREYSFVRLRELISDVSQGIGIRLTDGEPTGDIGLITIENLDDNSVCLIAPVSFVPLSFVKETDLLELGDVLTPRVRKIGTIGVLDASGQFVASENLLVIKLDDVALKRFRLLKRFIDFYLSFIGKWELQQLRTGGESGSINQWLLQEVRVPLVPEDKQIEIINEVERYEMAIRKLRAQMIPLQNTIDRVFIERGIKDSDSVELNSTTVFTSNLKQLSEQRNLRCGSRYRWFWDRNGGVLFKTSRPLIRLSEWIEEKRPKVVKKGFLPEANRILELEDLESRTGRVIIQRMTDWIGSDKVVLNGFDIATGKLRPYLGYTIVKEDFADETHTVIGTTELIPLKTTNSVIPSFAKYLLLSQEYLSKSKALMSGKEHPRLQKYDLLNIRVPIVEKTEQEKAVEEIESFQRKNDEKYEEVRRTRSEADNVVRRIILGE